MLTTVDNTTWYYQLFQAVTLYWFINYTIYKFFKIYWPANNKKLINLDCLACCCHCVIVELFLPLLIAFQILLALITLLDIISFFDLQSFIGLLIALFINFLKYTDLLTTKKSINLDCLAYCCHCVIILFYLLLLTTPQYSSFLDFECFINSLIALFVSFLKYTNLLITKKLSNLDCLAHFCRCVYYSQYFWIVFVSLPDQQIIIMLMNLDHLVIVAVIICFILQSLFTLSCYCCLPYFIVPNYLVLLLFSVQLIKLTLVEH